MTMTTQQVLARIRAFQEGFAAGAAVGSPRSRRDFLLGEKTAVDWRAGYDAGKKALTDASCAFTDALVDNPTLPGVPY